MSGENKSFNERLKGYQGILDQYSIKIGVAHIMYSAEANKAMLLTGEELRGMSPEECGETAFILAQYATFVEMEHNRENANLEWAEDNLTKIIAKEGDRYGDKYTKFEIKKARVLSDDSSAQVLGSIITEARGRATQLKGIASGIRVMAKYIDGLRQTKGFKK